ncbi:MAG: glycosyltransferase [Lachnospiraceae bacterium]|nr:glycosyltransferase [Lachnospiraceae bacterium]
MTISIIIPVYNVELYLEKCIQSIIGQSIQFDEIILVNDGSTDNSKSICEFYAKQYNNIILIEQDNQGLSEARNSGFRVAKGDYIIFLDSDDYMSIYTCEKLKSMLSSEIEILYYSADIVSDYGEQKRGNPYKRDSDICNQKMSGIEYFTRCFPQNWIVSACLAVYKKSFLETNRLSFMPGVYYEDNLFFMQCILNAKNIIIVPNAFYIRRYRENSIMTSLVNEKKCNDIVDIQIAIWEYLTNNLYFKDNYRLFLNYIFYTVISAENIIQQNANEEVKKKCRLKLIKYFIKYWENTINLENMNLNSSIILLWISKNLPYALKREKIKNIKKEIDCNIKNILSKLPLSAPEKYIAIYGIGEHTKLLFKFYKNYIGEINSKICFIKTSAEVNEKYMEKEVFSSNVIPEEVDGVIISSKVYQNQMVKELYKQGIEAERIYTLYNREDFVDLIAIDNILEMPSISSIAD